MTGINGKARQAALTQVFHCRKAFIAFERPIV